MKLGDGLFLNTFRRIAEEYKPYGIEANDMIVDNTSMQLVAKPQQFDVMVMPNLYGAIVSNIGAALVGGPGVVPGCNVGRDYALFEPGCRHVAADIMGKDRANPAAMILSSTMMLRHLGCVVCLVEYLTLLTLAPVLATWLTTLRAQRSASSTPARFARRTWAALTLRTRSRPRSSRTFSRGWLEGVCLIVRWPRNLLGTLIL